MSPYWQAVCLGVLWLGAAWAACAAQVSGRGSDYFRARIGLRFPGSQEVALML